MNKFNKRMYCTYVRT